MCVVPPVGGIIHNARLIITDNGLVVLHLMMIAAAQMEPWLTVHHLLYLQGATHLPAVEILHQEVVTLLRVAIILLPAAATHLPAVEILHQEVVTRHLVLLVRLHHWCAMIFRPLAPSLPGKIHRVPKDAMIRSLHVLEMRMPTHWN